MAAENFKVKKGLEVGTGITANSDGIDVTGIVTATQFQGDGSGLTGVVGSGSGVIVKDEGSAVGTAGTINFVGSGVAATLSAGTATVTVNAGSSNVSVANQADNRLITATGTTDALNAESNLTLASNGTMTLNGQATIDEVNINDNIVQTNTSNELVVRGKGVGGSHHLKLDDDVTIVGVTSGTIFKVPDATNASGATNHIAVGDNSDLKLYHDNNGDAYVSNATGHLTIRNDTAGRIINLQPKSGANGVIARYEGAAELYHNNQIKLTTTISGIEVPDLNVTGVGTIGRMDTNGVTLGTNNNTFAAKFIDDAVANFGTDNDLKISHDNVHARITNSTGDIVVVGIISATSDVKVGSAITMDPTSGIITATAFHGDGSNLSGISGGGGVTTPGGTANTVAGTNAGDAILSGATHNTLFGHNAGQDINTGDYNTFVGSRSGFNASTGLHNTGVGYNVMGNHSGWGGAALGRDAGNGMGGSNYSIAIGFGAYSNITANGNNNIVIGYQANVSSSSASNEVTIGNADITKFRIPGIGVTFKDNGGTPTQGHVLTVDANGEASFAAASGGGATDKIEEGDSSVEVIDTGTGKIDVIADSSYVARFAKENGNRTYMLVGNPVSVSNDYGNNTGHVIAVSNTTTRTATLRVFTSGTGLADDTVTGIIDFASQQSGTGGQTVSKIESSLRGGVENKSDLIFSTSNGGSPAEAFRISHHGGAKVVGVMTATSFSGSGASLTSLDAGNLGVGTIPNGRFPATLPAASGANLTSLTAGNISGTIASSQIADEAITFAKMQHVGTGVLIGRNDSGSGDIETLTAAEARTLLNVADGANVGVTTAAWTVGHNSSSNYVISGPGGLSNANNPDLYLERGQTYQFIVNASGHGFGIQTSSGTWNSSNAYTTGITNAGAAVGTITFEVRYNTPSRLYYACTSQHGGMVGNIYIIGNLLENGADNRVLTATSSYGMNGESGLTYNGSFLGVTGDVALPTTNRIYFGNSDTAYIKGEHGGSGYLKLGVNNTHVTLLRNGRVGIGTEDPQTQLMVAADSAQAIVTIKRTNSNGGAGSYGAINFAALDGHSVANMYALGDGDDNGAHLIFKTTSAAASNDTYNAATEERLRITSEGDMGLGTGGNTVTQRLDVRESSTTIFNPTSNLPTIARLYNTSSTNGASAGLQLRTDNNNGAAGIQYIHAVNSSTNYSSDLVFSRRLATSGSYAEACRITNAGNLKFVAGATKGIDFSAKTNLGGATDTTLAHYEEGTWTPTMTNLDVPGHVTTNWATYTRVGRIVTISVKFTISSSINDGSGFGFSLPWGPISDRQIVIPAISDRSGSNKDPFAFNNVNSTHDVFAKALEGYAFQTYNSFSGNYIIVTGSYETDA